MPRLLDALWPIGLLVLGAAVFVRTPAEGPLTTATQFCASPFDETVERLEGCLSRDPSNVGLLTALAVAHERDGRPDAAEAAYRRAVALDPRDGELHRRLAALLAARGDAAGAHEHAAIADRWQPGRSR